MYYLSHLDHVQGWKLIVLCLYWLGGFATAEVRAQTPSDGAIIFDDDDAKTILTKAIKAHGGTDKLSRWSRGYMKYKMTVGFLPPQLGEAILEDTFDLPGHFKRVIRGNKGADEVTVINVHNDGKGWVKFNNDEAMANENNFTDQPAHPFAGLCDFSKLSADKVELTRLADEKVGDRDVAVIKAKLADEIDAEFYIEKRTGLVIRTRKQVAEPNSKVPVTMVVVLEDHKSIQNGVYPTKLKALRDDKTLLEVTILEMKFLDKIDMTEFKKP